MKKASGGSPNLKSTVLFLAELWDERTRHHLQKNRLSMPAGEAIIGAITMIDALAHE